MGMMPALVPANDVTAEPSTTEAVLLQRAAEGDSAAFAELVRGIVRPALALAIRVLGDSGRAEDAVQDAITKLWQSAARFDPARGSFAGWWRRILMNSALDARRRLRPVVGLDEAAEVADAAPGPAAQAEAASLARAVQDAMAQLPDRQRAALALFHGEGLDMKEIGASIGATPKAVEGLLLRGRAALRASLAYLKDELQ